MTRGDVVIAAFQGDLGKPRPAIIIQSDLYGDTITVTLLPLTSHLREADLLRVTLAPSPENGLRSECQVMLDKLSTVSRSRIGSRIGRLSKTDLATIERLLAVFLGLADTPSPDMENDR